MQERGTSPKPTVAQAFSENLEILRSQALLRRVALEYVEILDEEVPQLRSAVESRERERVYEIVHRAKGSIWWGGDDFIGHIKNVRQAVRMNDWIEAESECEEAVEEARNLSGALRGCLRAF